MTLPQTKPKSLRATLAGVLLVVSAAVAGAALLPGQRLVEPAPVVVVDAAPAVENAMDAIAESADSSSDAALADADARIAADLVADGRARIAQAVAGRGPVFREWRETVTEERGWRRIAFQFGIGQELFEARNPDIDLDALLPGDDVLVWRYLPDDPPRSVGAPNRGRLISGMPMPDGPYWNVRERRDAYGTWYTISHLVRGFTATGEAFADTDPVVVCDISNRRGGRMSPHRSHRSGRDADVAYYLTGVPPASTNMQTATTETLDVARQWYLFRHWIERDAISYIFVDTRLQRVLYQHALSIGESPEFLEGVFAVAPGSHRPLIRHARGHRDHFHVRFRCDATTDQSCRE